jgi:serine/threonine-protein kinase
VTSGPGPEPLSAERWATIEAVFSEVLEAPTAERAALLDRRCAGDEALRRAVESLLLEHEGDPAFLDAPPLWPAPPKREGIPERIGPCRVLRLLGRGGMGQVWLAEREAPGFRQLVAVKVMRRGMDTDELVARFRTERQILASLSHPNIARLLDVGATEDGLPFLVMEYIDGKPLLESCDDRRLSLEARLDLFRQICAAVQHAHRNLVVHRDLKPTNILVTADGTPKLLDFGIARMLEPGQDAESSPRTRDGLRLLTPEYASPEQIRGETLTTACDVWALGVMLYELLCGRHPFGEPAAARTDMERRVLAIEPPPPSAALDDPAAAARGADPGPLRRRLRGDLDTIVLKALRKEPDERYASVLSLAEDLDRHRAGTPVRARPATAAYRLRKFVARNRLGVAAGTTLILVLAASTAITRYQSGRIREESARVMRERDKALEVRTFLLEMFGTTGPDQATGDTVTARQLLDRRAATLATLYADDPELRADMMFVLAEGYEKLGLLAAAEPLARDALALRRELFGDRHPDVVAALDLLGWVLHQRSRPDEAETVLREAVTTGRAVFGETGDTRLARALNDLGVVREARGDYDEAAALYRESLDMRSRIPGQTDIGTAVTTSNLSVVLYRKGDLDSAVAMATAAHDLFRRVLGPDHQRTSVVQNNLAAMQSAKGDHEGAARQHREILERRTRLFGPRHPQTAFSMSALASELMASGRSDEAEPLLRDALSIQASSEGTLRLDLAQTQRLLADLEYARRRFDLALAHYQQAYSTRRAVLGDTHASLVDLLRRMAGTREELGDPAGAEASLRQAGRVAAAALGHANPRTAGARLALADLLRKQRRWQEALGLMDLVEAAADSAGVAADDASRRRASELRAALLAARDSAR